MERERMEAENRRIMEFVSNQDTKKESRMTQMREREEAKENLRKQVEAPLTMLKRFFVEFPCSITRCCKPFFPQAVRENPEGNSAARRDGTSPGGVLLGGARAGTPAERDCEHRPHRHTEDAAWCCPELSDLSLVELSPGRRTWRRRYEKG